MSFLRVAATFTWAALSIAGFGLSLGAHVLSFFGVSLTDRVPLTWVLHLGIFVVVLPLFLVARSHSRPGSSSDRWKLLFWKHPSWVIGAVEALIAYAVINFGVVFYLSRGGKPEIVDNQIVLESHGRVIRRLTAEEYEYQRALTTRMFSGHWMLFYGIPLLYLGFGRRQGQGSELESTP
jgi:hypothetical protein